MSASVSYIFGDYAPAGVELINREYAWGLGNLYRRGPGDELFRAVCPLPFQGDGFRAFVGPEGVPRFMSEAALVSMARFEPYRWFEYDPARNAFAVQRVELFEPAEAPASPQMVDQLASLQRLNVQWAENLRLAAEAQEQTAALFQQLAAEHAELKERLAEAEHRLIGLADALRQGVRQVRDESRRVFSSNTELGAIERTLSNVVEMLDEAAPCAG